MQLGARNQLKGTVKKVEHGAVNSEVTIELADGIEVVSIITKESAEQWSHGLCYFLAHLHHLIIPGNSGSVLIVGTPA